MAADAYSLDRLQDIVEPVAVSWWPPAPGAWLLPALILVWLGVVMILLRNRYRRNQYRREGLALLKKIAPDLKDEGTRQSALARLDELLKRVALSAYPRDQVASLSGGEWAAFLDRAAGGDGFRSGPAAVVVRASYEPQSGAELSGRQRRQILASVRRWIKGHRRDGQR